MKPLAEHVPTSDDWGQGLYVPLPSPPPKISGQEELELLELAVTRLSQPKQRMAGLKILVETRKTEAFPILRNLLAKSRHLETTTALIHLIGLQRSAADVPEFERLLDHREAVVRAAAADAIGYVHLPTSHFPDDKAWMEGWQRALNVEPPIIIGYLEPAGSGKSQEVVDLEPRIRTRLEEMMLTGTTDIERAAAAGAIVNWPPKDCRFRYAEWGVWLDDRGDLKLIRSVLDEIPPFVHQTGNPLSEFQNRIDSIMSITKPVVHITADRPLAIDLEIQIRQGRPWYAYPRPDDFSLEAGTRYLGFPRNERGRLQRESPSKRSPALLDNGNIGSLFPVEEGYSWGLPKHRSVGARSGSMGAYDNVITSVGLRWQSLIVSPNRETWMVPPDVGDNPKFAWWKSLREVPSSWVSSHGETERFLYYDGPTFAKSPVVVSEDRRQLKVVTQSMITWEPYLDFSRTANFSRMTSDRKSELKSPARTGFLIDVGVDSMAAREFSIPGAADQVVWVELFDEPRFKGKAAVERLQTILIQAGLTKRETGGLIVSWRKQFFETPGKRLLTILSREDYDEICPMKIRPWPTETARVGIVLTEMSD
ncbi:MAG: hypothetical protein ACR2FY_08745 [Pirellulaceae bacterium]